MCQIKISSFTFLNLVEYPIMPLGAKKLITARKRRKNEAHININLSISFNNSRGKNLCQQLCFPPLVPYNHTDFSYTPRNTHTHTQVEYILPFFFLLFSHFGLGLILGNVWSLGLLGLDLWVWVFWFVRNCRKGKSKSWDFIDVEVLFWVNLVFIFTYGYCLILSLDKTRIEFLFLLIHLIHFPL